MALKALLLRKKIDDKKKELEALRAKNQEFQTREDELAKSIEEVQTDEERTQVEELVNAFDAEKKEHTDKITGLENEITGLETDLAAEEAAQSTEPPPADHHEEERKDDARMITRDKIFSRMSIQERSAFFARQDVKDYLANVRACIREKRALTNVGLTIPEVMVPMLREIVESNSKLLGHVTAYNVAGKTRQTIMGDIPEAIWLEQCATLPELSLGFNQIEVDAYKVGGYFAVCNATLEDSDLNLATELLNAIGIGIAKATDRAIIYGTGIKMPHGIVPRLAQTAKPSDYAETRPAWKDLHESNIITITGKTGLELFQKIVEATKAIANNYFQNGIVWVMNKRTHTDLLVQSMGKNMNAALVAGMNNSMPVVGGEIIELPFMADGDIAFGYFDAYTWANRHGVELGQSEHYRFIEDQTVFKGTMRADGDVVIAEAFGILNINGTAPTTSATFPTANTDTEG